MRIYYLFKINNAFSNLYYNKTFYLYKMLEQISKSSKNDFIISYRLFEQMALPFNKEEINSIINTKYYYDNEYERYLNKHILNSKGEKTKLTVYNTYIKIRTNNNITSFFNVLNKESNIFVCDFNNKDYFWLSRLNSLQKEYASIK